MKQNASIRMNWYNVTKRHLCDVAATCRPNVVTDTNFVSKVKDFEGQVPTVTGLDLALALSLLTPAELAQYTNGEKLELSLEINKAGALMTDDVITLVTNALKDQENAKLDGAYYIVGVHSGVATVHASTTAAITTVSPKTGGEDATDGLLLLMGTISAMIAIAAKVYEFRRRKEEE